MGDNHTSHNTSEGEPKTGDSSSFSSINETYFGRKRRLRKYILALLVAGLLFLIWFIPPVYLLLEGPVIVTRYVKKSGEIRALVGPKEKEWTPYQKVSRHFINAVVASEDGRFYQHSGLDFAEIKRSYEINKKKNRYVRGGSTITQQVVKMAFLGREKTLIRKAREALGAIILELFLSKEKILEWYVNLMELGDGVYGIGAGSQHYFRTKPELLTIEQSVHLALVLPSPNLWSKGLRNQSLTSFGHKRFSAILLRMRQSQFITPSQWMTAVSRGNFGRPIQGYATLIAREEALKKETQSDELSLDEADFCMEEFSECEVTGAEESALKNTTIPSNTKQVIPQEPSFQSPTLPSQERSPPTPTVEVEASKPSLPASTPPANPTAEGSAPDNEPPALKAPEGDTF